MVTDDRIAPEKDKLEESKANLRRTLEKLRDNLAEDGLVLDVDAAYAALTAQPSLDDFITRPPPASRH